MFGWMVELQILWVFCGIVNIFAGVFYIFCFRCSGNRRGGRLLWVGWLEGKWREEISGCVKLGYGWLRLITLV